MNVIRATTELPPRNRKVCLAIGFFDGVHLGHQQILRQTIADAQQHEATSLVITFDSHPSTIVAPERVPPLIYTRSQRLRYIEKLGPDALLLIHFNKSFSQKTGEQFICELLSDFTEVKSICVGSNFHFGYKRTGNVSLLQKLGEQYGFAVHGMAAVSLDGEPVSSTRIRDAIQRGDLDAASQMLGRAYSLAGTVVRGDGIGQQLGFPTANLDVTGLALPPRGVYAAHVAVDGSIYRGALNIGVRPTLKQIEPQQRVEVHLLDFVGDLYCKELEITFARKLREERKFGSLDELKTQIADDLRSARQSF